MKPSRRLLLSVVAATTLPFALTSCVTDAYVGTGVYYGGQRSPWFHDDPWVDGHRWYVDPPAGARIGIYLHPPRTRR